MNRCILLCLCLIVSLGGYAQIVKPGKLFKEVSEIEGKVVFLKEININKDNIADDPFKILKKWTSENYGSDHFYSSIRFDNKNEESVVKSRVELILPEKNGKRASIVMKYKLNCFIYQEKCVLEIEDISYVDDCFKKNKLYQSRLVNAIQLISNDALKLEDELQEVREDIKKSTLYFFNQLANELEIKFGQPKLMDN